MRLLATWSMVAGFMCLGLYSAATTTPDLPDQEYVIPVLVKAQSLYTVQHHQEDLEWLSLNIYHEARGEDLEGQLAVAWVTLNRYWHPDYPDSLREVVQDRAQSGACQFSWVCELDDFTPHDQESWQRAQNLAMRVLTDYTGSDPTNGSLYYHATRLAQNQPFRTMRVEPEITIGNHIFYQRTSY